MSSIIAKGVGLAAVGLTIAAAIRKVKQDDDAQPTKQPIVTVKEATATTPKEEIKGFFYNTREYSIPIYKYVVSSALLGQQPQLMLAKVPQSVYLGQATGKTLGNWIELYTLIDDQKYMFWADANNLMDAARFNPNHPKSEVLKKQIINNY